MTERGALPSSNGTVLSPAGKAVRRWRVWFGGDPEYGEASRGEYERDAVTVEAIDGSTAARKAVAEWRRSDAWEVREEGWYGNGTRVYVQEVFDPPPLLVYVREGSRMKKERG